MASPYYDWEDTAQNSFNTTDNDDIYFPCLGIVLDVYPSDSTSNFYSNNIVQTANQQEVLRGAHTLADVLIIQDRKQNSWIATNVVILPNGACGMDNYTEEFPRPCTTVLDGSDMDRSLGSINPMDLDGDMCLVQFIGGNISRAVMTSYFPHFRNIKDPATSGSLGKLLQQIPRFYKRYNGLQFLITPQGSIFVNTNESNSQLELDTSAKQYDRTKSDKGGFIQIDIKPEQFIEINSNPTVSPKDTDPSVPQQNPADSGSPDTRKTDNSRFKLTKDDIDIIAGAVAKLLKQDGASIQVDDNIDIKSKNGAEITMNEDTVINSKIGSLVELNGSDYKLPKWSTGTGNFTTDFGTFLTQLLTALQVGTVGSPVKQQLVGLLAVIVPLQQFVAKVQSGAYDSIKVKNG